MAVLQLPLGGVIGAGAYAVCDFGRSAGLDAISLTCGGSADKAG